MKIATFKRGISSRLLFVGAVFLVIVSSSLVQSLNSQRTYRKVSSYNNLPQRKIQSDPGAGEVDSKSRQKSQCDSLKNPKCRRKPGTKSSNKLVPPSLANVTTLTTPRIKALPVVQSLATSGNSSQPYFHTSLNKVVELSDLAKSMLRQRKKCKSAKHKGFKCQRLKWYTSLIKRLDESTTNLNPWFQLVRNEDLSSNMSLDASDLMPDNWPEEYIYKLLQKWGGPMEQLVFHKYKEFVKSRELKLKVPHLFEVKVSPRTHVVAETGRSTPRLFWDPGFNLKLKLPFFKDELKVAISTGPSFLAGIATGFVLLIIKSLLAPFLFGLKWMLYNLFWKDGNPWDMMKMVWGGSHGPEPWESQAPPPAIEHYEPPHVHNQFDNMKEHHPFGDGGGQSGYGFGYNGYNDQKLQFSQLNPILQGLTGSSSFKSSLEEGRRQHFKSLLTGPEDSGGGGGYGVTGGGSIISESQDSHVKHPNDLNYIPSTGLQSEVENYDPFYSPFLSRIDSIFTHLGYHEEGCRERAVCSIYKFPVKYAPYSNLLSAQLSKHQSELKRPVTKSPKILRYFKYMKAAKDGQGQASCIETYPSCDHDTDSVTNLPMITTFTQLSELMGAEATGPTGS